MLGHGLADVLVDGQKSLAGSPVPSPSLAFRMLEQGDFLANAHLAHELTAEGVDDTGHGGGLALADEVEVEHALHGTGLQSAVPPSVACPPLTAFFAAWSFSEGLLDEASCLRVEEGVRGRRAQGPRGSGKTLDVVVGREVVAGGSGLGRGGPVDGRGGRHVGQSRFSRLSIGGKKEPVGGRGVSGGAIDGSGCWCWGSRVLTARAEASMAEKNSE